MGAEVHKENLMGDTDDEDDSGGSLSLNLPVSKQGLMLLGAIVVAAVVAWEFLRGNDDTEDTDSDRGAEVTDTNLGFEEELARLDERVREDEVDEGTDEPQSFEEEQEAAVNEMMEDKPEYGGE